MHGKKLIGFKRGLAVYVSENLLAQKGEREVFEEFGLIRRYPVTVDLSGRFVMVEGDSHEDAIERYLSIRAIAKREVDTDMEKLNK